MNLSIKWSDVKTVQLSAYLIIIRGRDFYSGWLPLTSNWYRRRHRHLSLCLRAPAPLAPRGRRVPNSFRLDRPLDRPRSLRPSAARRPPPRRGRWRPTFPSFLRPLPCQTFAKAGQIGRARRREDDEIISASEWIAVPQSDIARSVGPSIAVSPFPFSLSPRCQATGF